MAHFLFIRHGVIETVKCFILCDERKKTFDSFSIGKKLHDARRMQIKQVAIISPYHIQYCQKITCQKPRPRRGQTASRPRLLASADASCPRLNRVRPASAGDCSRGRPAGTMHRLFTCGQEDAVNKELRKSSGNINSI